METKNKALPKWEGMPLEVLRIDDHKNSLPEELGISEERLKELKDAIQKQVLEDKEGCTIDNLILAGKISKHPNELAFCCCVIGRIEERVMQKHAGFLKLLEQMVGKENKG